MGKAENKHEWALNMCAHKVREVAEHIMPGDPERRKVAKLLGVKDDTLDAKVRYGRFSAAELFLAARSLGYSVQVVKRDDLIG